MSIVVRAIEVKDRNAWEQLWQAYLVFYETSLPDTVTEATWGRMFDTQSPVHGLVAEAEDGSLVGMTTYLFHETTWSAEPRCYLHDLFTIPESRGRGVARGLINAVKEAAKINGACEVYWMTQESNGQARKLYDKVATQSPYVEYVLKD
jgi:GNAT superfamily N-acetyltransferase